MGMLDGLLGQGAGAVDLAGLGARFGLSPQQVEAAIAALGLAHPAPGDTATTAASHTGLPVEALRQIIDHLGGEEALGRLASMLGTQAAPAGEADAGIEGILGNLAGKFLGRG